MHGPLIVPMDHHADQGHFFLSPLTHPQHSCLTWSDRRNPHPPGRGAVKAVAGAAGGRGARPARAPPDPPAPRASCGAAGPPVSRSTGLRGGQHPLGPAGPCSRAGAPDTEVTATRSAASPRGPAWVGSRARAAAFFFFFGALPWPGFLRGARGDQNQSTARLAPAPRPRYSAILAVGMPGDVRARVSEHGTAHEGPFVVQLARAPCQRLHAGRVLSSHGGWNTVFGRGGRGPRLLAGLDPAGTRFLLRAPSLTRPWTCP